MWSFRRKNGKQDAGGAAVAEPREIEFEDYEGTDQELFEEIEQLIEAGRTRRSHEVDRRLVHLRHIAGVRLMDSAPPDPQYPEPDSAHLPESDTLPNISPAQVTPQLLRAGILRDGCLLIRGFVPREVALRMAEQIDRAFVEREHLENGEPAAEGYYEELTPHPRFPAEIGRAWVKEGGGVLACDSPMLSFEMVEMFRVAGVPQLASAYLGEPALSSLHKTTLRKAEPQVGGAWHQDGSFMGPVRSLNLWLSLSRCGDIAPGLDVVPRRLDDFVATGGDEAVFTHMQVSQRRAAEAAGDKGIIRPIFEPGDALFFDEKFLHQTGSDPSMPKPRYAIESWFFGGSAFPADYAPISL